MTQAKGRYRSNPRIEELLQQIWRQGIAEGTDLKAYAVLGRARALLVNRGETCTLPAVRKAQMILQPVRRAHHDMPEHLKEKLQALKRPWTIDSLDIAPEALRAVCRVQRLLYLTGFITLTVGEAKWAARLAPIIEDTQILHRWAYRYCAAEAEAIMLGESFAAAELDKALLLSPWQLATLCLTGEPYPQEAEPGWLGCIDYAPAVLTGPRDATLQWPSSTDYAAGSLHSLASASEYAFLGQDWECGHKEIVGPIADVALSQEAEWVYIRWLRYLQSGPEITALTFATRAEIIAELRTWTKNQERLQRYDDWTTFDELLCDELRPVDLLRTVGYQV